MKTIILLVLLTTTPESGAPIEARIEWQWINDDVEDCKAFVRGATLWHPRGELHAIGSCIEREPASVQ